jgi:hypothetical protein
MYSFVLNETTVSNFFLECSTINEIHWKISYVSSHKIVYCHSFCLTKVKYNFEVQTILIVVYRMGQRRRNRRNS